MVGEIPFLIVDFLLWVPVHFQSPRPAQQQQVLGGIYLVGLETVRTLC